VDIGKVYEVPIREHWRQPRALLGPGAVEAAGPEAAAMGLKHVLIVTSGLGGVYPAGIPIGTVLGELRTSEGWARTYLVRPAVRPPDVSNVIVLLPKRIQGQSLERVWRSAASADSAARHIAAAGDSLARRAAADSVRAAEAAAARRAADSVSGQPLQPPAARPPAADTARRTQGRADTPRPAPRKPDAPRPGAER